MRLAVKVDVDTLRGYREGVPRLLDLFKKHGIKASIFFSFGPDNSGKAIRRIFRKGFISKMLRTKAPSTYGLKTMLYGTILPAPLIVPSAPDVFKRAFDDGHDCGIHAWDHVLIQDKLAHLSREEFRSLYDKAASLYEKISGAKPYSYAAPGWQLSAVSLVVQQELGLEYCSDVRHGTGPFLPVYEGKEYRPVQVPATLPTMDEIFGLPGIDDNTLPDCWLKGLDKEWNVVTVHAEMEGMAKLGVLDSFLTKAEERGAEYHTLREYAKMAKAAPCEIKMGYLTGRAGKVAVQEINNG